MRRLPNDERCSQCKHSNKQATNERIYSCRKYFSSHLRDAAFVMAVTMCETPMP